MPLDLFLPKDGSHRRFKNGLAWKQDLVFRDSFEDLRQTAEEGCVLCTIFVRALEEAEPLWATGGDFTSKGHNMLLHPPKDHPAPMHGDSPEKVDQRIALSVTNEGEMVITDGRRKGGIYWHMPSFGYGHKLSMSSWRFCSSGQCTNQSTDQTSSRADSGECYTQAMIWLSTCMDHDACNADQNPAFVPTRLIRIDGYHDSIVLKLELGNHRRPASRPDRYFTLSYCWGTDLGKTVPKTTRDNLDRHRDMIDMRSLPTTFQDAMRLVLVMGFHYIWIDSLCIVQDDPEDFTRECALMHQIYANSICTISVSCLFCW